jgi:hypothetical protein
MRRPPRQLDCERKPPPKLETDDYSAVGMSIAKKDPKEAARVWKLLTSRN